MCVFLINIVIKYIGVSEVRLRGISGIKVISAGNF